MNKFKNMKFDIAGKPELSEIIQRMLVELGYHIISQSFTSTTIIAAWEAGGVSAYGDKPISTEWLRGCKLTTLSELAKILQEHYASQDIVKVGDVLEIEADTKFYLTALVHEGCIQLISLEDGNRRTNNLANSEGSKTTIDKLEKANNCKILKNHGPLKDLNIQRLLVESDE